MIVQEANAVSFFPYFLRVSYLRIIRNLSHNDTSVSCTLFFQPFISFIFCVSRLLLKRRRTPFVQSIFMMILRTENYDSKSVYLEQYSPLPSLCNLCLVFVTGFPSISLFARYFRISWSEQKSSKRHTWTHLSKNNDIQFLTMSNFSPLLAVNIAIVFCIFFSVLCVTGRAIRCYINAAALMCWEVLAVVYIGRQRELFWFVRNLGRYCIWNCGSFSSILFLLFHPKGSVPRWGSQDVQKLYAVCLW